MYWERLLEPDYLSVYCMVIAMACVQFSKKEIVHFVGAVFAVTGITLYALWIFHVI